MVAWATLASQLLVRTALAAIPLALIVAALCRWLPSRPATRHTLWLVLVGWFLVSPMLPGTGVWNGLTAKLSAPSIEPPSLQVNSAAPAGTDTLEEVPVHGLRPIAQATDLHPWLQSCAPAGANEPVSSPSPSRSRYSPFGLVQLAPFSLRKTIKEWTSYRVAAAPRIRESTATSSHISTAASNTMDEAIDATEPEASVATLPVESETAPAAEAAAPGNDRWSEWIAWLAVVRDMPARLPSLPPAVVFGGIVLLCCGHALRTLLFLRRLRQTVETPASVIALVNRCARRIGLRRAPIVRMTDANVSPMIWCGRQARLILPVPLWLQLDDVGREAIVCHELAHLKRRDHWWCWGDLIAGTLYWWHPLVWWVRRRLHEEAELSCDAWVVWLLPHGRRAYAEALLRTNESVGRAYRVGPAVGMAVAGGRKRQFARRLTMVMTKSTRPRMSFAGLALAAVIAAAGWAAIPARSCPPESGEKVSQPIAAVEISSAVDEAVQSVNLVVAQPGALPVRVIASATACPPEETTPKAKRGGTGVSNTAHGGKKLGISTTSDTVTVVEPVSGRTTTIRPAQGGVRWQQERDRVAELERQLAELSARVEELSAHVGRAPRARTPRPPSPPRAAVPPLPTPRPHAMPSPAPAPRARTAPRSDATVVRTYLLPKGKLDAMWGLMSRSDVPTLVRSIKGGIEVIATEAQHEVFEAFVRLINPEGQATPRGRGAGAAADEAARAKAGAEIAHADKSRAEKAQAEQAHADRARATALRDKLRAAEERARSLSVNRRALQFAQEKHAEELRQREEEMREESDAMREKADDEGNDEGKKEQRKTMLDRAKQLEYQAKTLEQQLKSAEREAVEMEKLGDVLEEQCDALSCLRETVGEVAPGRLATLLREAAMLARGGEAHAVAAAMNDFSDALDHEWDAKLDHAVTMDSFPTLGALTEQLKELERLCEALREKAGAIEAREEQPGAEAHAD